MERERDAAERGAWARILAYRNRFDFGAHAPLTCSAREPVRPYT